jgi:hypothetical protein
MFWDDLNDFHKKSINHSFVIGNLTTLQRQGIISLIPKLNKDLTNLSNCRPIGLLNVYMYIPYVKISSG